MSKGWKPHILKAMLSGVINKSEAVTLLKNIDRMQVSWWASDEPEHKKFMDLFHRVTGITKIEWVD